ncbi:MAG: hypothetical protein ABSG33_08395 [Candidatus Bathyarchaeia archaeon]|jgi:hypothetical protein
MSEELKGFCDASGEILKRKVSLCTEKGIVIYKGERDQWYLNFPDDTKRIGVTTIGLINLLYYLNETDGNLDRSRKLAGWE